MSSFREKCNIQNTQNGLMNWYLGDRSSILDAIESYDHAPIQNSLNTRYPAHHQNCAMTISKSVTVRNHDDRSKDDYSETIDRIRDIVLQLNRDSRIVDYFLIHGSLSSNDFVRGWSDLDSIVVLDDNIMTDISRLFDLRAATKEVGRRLLEIDKHQHHGLQFIRRSDTAFYPESYLPISIMSDAIDISDNSTPTIEFGVRNSKIEQLDRWNSIEDILSRAAEKGRLEHHKYQGEFLLGEFKNTENNMYQLKYFISLMCVIPCYFYNILGEYPNKSTAISDIKKILSNRSLMFLDQISEIRSSWSEFPIVSNAIPEWVPKVLDHDYLSAGNAMFVEMDNVPKAHERFKSIRL